MKMFRRFRLRRLRKKEKRLKKLKRIDEDKSILATRSHHYFNYKL